MNYYFESVTAYFIALRFLNRHNHRHMYMIFCCDWPI